MERTVTRRFCDYKIPNTWNGERETCVNEAKYECCMCKKDLCAMCAVKWTSSNRNYDDCELIFCASCLREIIGGQFNELRY